MAPTEKSILTNYLLVPAPLPSIVTLQQFTAMFPKSMRSSPQIRTLYRDLQHQRTSTIDAVAEKITAEVAHGKAQRTEMLRMRKGAEREDPDDELEIERALCGPDSDAPGRRHNLSSIIPEMDSAVADMEAEIKKLEEEEAALLSSVEQAVGSMSDLRYGRFANSQLLDGVMEGLKEFQETCERRT